MSQQSETISRRTESLLALLQAAPWPVYALLNSQDQLFLSGAYLDATGQPVIGLEEVLPDALIARVSAEHPATRTLFDIGWGQNWVALVMTDAAIEDVAAHLGTYLRGMDRQGREVVVPFYKPCNLRRFVASLSASDAKTFFGPVRLFLVEDRNLDDAVFLSVSVDAVRCESRPLDARDLTTVYRGVATGV